MIRAAPGESTLAAFLATVLLGGFNGISIRVSNQELAPFWGGTLRFGLAAAALLVLVALLRVALPRGRALAGSVVYGGLGFGTAFALGYWALVEVPAGLAQVILALVPLLTLLLAVAHGLERFRWQGAAGAVVAVVGVAVIFGDRIGTDIPLAPMLAILAGAACIAEATVLVKRFPRSHPLANNAVAMSTGAAILVSASLVGGEPRVLPSEPQTWLAVGYLALVGSVIVFGLFLYIIARWTASATSYILLLMPLVTVPASAVILGEPLTPAFLLGAAFVLAGVYLGAFAPSIARPLPGLALPGRRPATTTAAAAADAGRAAEQRPPALENPCP